MELDLDGEWRARPDPTDMGRREDWASVLWPEEAVIYLPVPGLWQTSRPDLTGAVWYERTFTSVLFPDGGHAELRVGAANYLADVWLNGVYLGRHEGGYTPFSFSLDGAISPGENRLVIRVADVTDDQHEFEGLLARQIPGGKERWYYQASGIWQSVAVRFSGPSWFEDVRLLPDLARAELCWRLAIGAGYSGPETLTIEVLDAAGSCVAGDRREIALHPGTLRSEGILALNEIHAWSPADPYLYTVRARLEKGGEIWEARTGFRDFTMLDGRFHLNGPEIFLKCILLQPNYPATLLYPPDRDWARRELTAAKEAGFNLIRLHLLPPVPFVLDLADEIGLLVYEESPAGWIKEGPRLAEHCRRECAEMIRRDWNHPSVVIWGLLNENVPAARALGTELLTLAAGLDPTRIAIGNSGGTGAIDQYFAWADQCQYFLPGEGIVSAIDLHLYLGQVEETALSWLAGLGDPEKTEGLLAAGYGRPEDLATIRRSLSSWAGGIFVSEYGFGGCEDLAAVVASFPDEAVGPDRAVAEGYLHSLEKCLGLPGIAPSVGSVGDFVAAAEEIHGQAVFDQTMAMRINPRVSGYGLTQLNDCSWEFAAGLLDRWRRPKPSLARARAANDPLQIVVWPGRYAFCAGEEAVLRAWLVAEETIAGEFRLEVDGRVVESRPVAGRDILDLGSQRVRLAETGWHAARAVFAARGGKNRTDTRRLLVLPKTELAGSRPAGGKSAGEADPPLFLSAGNGLDAEAIRAALSEVRDGRTMILADLDPEGAEVLAATGQLPYQFDLRPAGGSWMPTWHVVPAHSAFAGLPTGLAGPLYAPILPRYAWANPVGDVLAWALRGTIHCGIHVGSTNYEFEQWGDLVAVPHGAGRIIFCQYRLGRQDPVAETILANLGALRY